MSKFNSIISLDQPVLVDFYADWCAPCKMMAPILEQVKKLMGNDLRIIKIDVDRNPEIAQRYSIRSIPTMILFRKGEKLWTGMGAMQANQLVQTIRQHLN